MFQVANVEVESKSSSVGNKEAASASFALSVKNTESYRLARRYDNQEKSQVSVVAMPQAVLEEYDIIYMNEYDSLIVGKERHIWNPFDKSAESEGEILVEQPKNVTITQVYIHNLERNSSYLNISFYSDADPEHKFRKLFTNAPINKNGTYDVNAKLQCHDYMILKVETVEGFHSKTFSCSEMSHSETFVTRMSSLISKVNFVTDYNQIASELMQPIQSGEVQDAADYMKRNDINQAVSTGLAKKSFDEEIIYHLKKRTEDSEFNMIEVFFGQTPNPNPVLCSTLKFYAYMLVGYPFWVYQSMMSFGEVTEQFWM